MKRKLTPKQQVLKKYPKAYAGHCDWRPDYGWAIFVPFRYTVTFRTAAQAWAEASRSLKC